LDQDQIKIEIIDEGKSGIFGLGTSRPAKIRVFYNDLEANIAEQVREFLDGLLQKMNFDGTVFEIKEGKSKIYVELKSKDSALIIGHRGKTLEAIQLLANMHLTHLNGDSFNKRIILDIESYRRKREIALNRLAKMIAKNVIKSGKPKLLEPMNPFERRLIHLTLQDHDKVTTISEGNGIYKRIRIQLKDK
jgi:spoIIIJ-associated protein